MDKNLGEIHTIIDRAIDEAMCNGRFLFKCYDYLKLSKWTRKETNNFIESTTASNITNLVVELDDYLEGKDKTLKEAYGHLSKPHVRKIRNYLQNILEDATKYSSERKPGRKPKPN